MKPREILRLLHVGRPPAPYDARRLARVHSIEGLARAARRRLPAAAAGYLDGGGEGEYTLHRNRSAFDSYEIVPSTLHDVSDLDTSATLLGQPSPLPLALAPIGAPRLFHHEGELAVARAARHAGIPYALSTLATTSLERVAAETNSPLWFQLYLWGDRGVARALVERAAALGYRALLVSVDVSVRSKRERELRAGLKLPSPDLTVQAVLDGARHPRWSWHFLTSDTIGFPNVGGGRPSASPPELARMFDGTLTWDDIEWIRQCWQGPLALKGILSADDARRAVGAGADAVIVSNHGGRQLDHVPATIDILEAVVDAAGDSVDVLLDSGIRRGTDILTALAVGARGVLVGRPYLYGLAAAGEAGVRHAVDILAGELRTAMALSGAASLASLDRRLIRRAGPSPEPRPGAGPAAPSSRRSVSGS